MTVRQLSAGEVQRLRYELGANVLNVGAEPYIPHQRVFDVIQANLTSDAQDPATSSTSVVVAGGAVLTLDAVTGLALGARVVLDVDDAHEVATVKQVAGATIAVLCQAPHAAPFPVEIESGLTLVRCKLWTLAQLDRQVRAASGVAGLRKADEVEFFGAAGERTALGELLRQQAAHRAELASLVNLQQVLEALGFARGGTSFALY